MNRSVDKGISHSGGASWLGELSVELAGANGFIFFGKLNVTQLKLLLSGSLLPSGDPSVP